MDKPFYLIEEFAVRDCLLSCDCSTGRENVCYFLYGSEPLLQIDTVWYIELFSLPWKPPNDKANLPPPTHFRDCERRKEVDKLHDFD